LALLCTLHCTALHCTALHCTALHCTALLWLASSPCTAPLDYRLQDNLSRPRPQQNLRPPTLWQGTSPLPSDAPPPGLETWICRVGRLSTACGPTLRLRPPALPLVCFRLLPPDPICIGLNTVLTDAASGVEVLTLPARQLRIVSSPTVGPVEWTC
jgi:hypothetical protein